MRRNVFLVAAVHVLVAVLLPLATTGSIAAAQDGPGGQSLLAEAIAAEPSVVLDSAGNALVAYTDRDPDGPAVDPSGERVPSNRRAIRFVRCDDSACNGEAGQTHTLVADDAYGPHIGVDSANRAIVAYGTDNPQSSGVSLWICNDTQCSNPQTVALDVPSGSVPIDLAIDGSNRPVVAYSSASKTWILRCDSSSCASSTTGGGWDGTANSMVLDASGFPALALDSTTPANPAGVVKVVRCANDTCTGAQPSELVNGSNGRLVLSDDGFPVVAYDAVGATPGGDALSWVVHCDDANCAEAVCDSPLCVSKDATTAEPTSGIAQPGGLVTNETIDLALNSDGVPVVFMRAENTNQTPSLATALVATCAVPLCAGTGETESPIISIDWAKTGDTAIGADGGISAVFGLDALDPNSGITDYAEMGIRYVRCGNECITEADPGPQPGTPTPTPVPTPGGPTPTPGPAIPTPTPVPPSQNADVMHAVSCLAGNGRVDTNIVNNGVDDAAYRIEFQGLTPRQTTVTAGDWWRMPITGRPDGNYQVTVKRAGVDVSVQTLTVACDTTPPSVSDAEVSVVNACRASNGYVLFQFVNPTAAQKGYVIEFQGVANRSTSAAAYGGSIRAVTGRPDNTYTVNIRSGGVVFFTTSVTVDCDA